MTKIEEQIVSILIKNNVLTQAIVPEIQEKMDIGLTLGEVLVGDNYLSQENFCLILAELYKRRQIDYEDVREKFSIDQKEFLQVLAKKQNLTYMNLDDVDIDFKLSERAPMAQLKKFGVIPVRADDLNIYVAFSDPFNMEAQDRIQAIFNKHLLKIVVADPNQVNKYMAKLELSESIKDLVATIRKELASTGGSGTGDDTSAILQLIEMIVKQSIIMRGSDIHIEPTENNCVVRTRIDGMLQEIFIFDKDIYPPLVSRLKLLSNMDIAERRKPQDGRFSMTISGREYDFRISTLPIINGESTVMRILDKSKVIISLEKLGMHPESFKKFSNAMHAPYGIILVTGPTGSGKSTTLYAALNDVKSVDTKIITVEDPVEYQVNLIQQVHVNEKAGLTFASALRSILRQDPDIIMIGEIRDQETLRIAIQAALTGHLVFSTLHTNDAVSAIPRIVDMGIESYLISGALIAVEAQRLVRKLCPHCKQPTNVPKSMLDQLKEFLPEQYKFFKAVGCDQCGQTGYMGREMISEILPITDRMQSLIANGGSKDDMRALAKEEGFIDMFEDGIIRAARGVTSIEEIYRVAKQ
ncbi:GspE/PulE family protein [Campylobacter sp. VBCF_06 NA8]|uniref:GspE/PulE family protein n=1 Tax=unclassified Campylobacter TaxID=2593542 RepID=UPI0022E9C4D6|nr:MULTISPECIES: GspE/PulE family protein [unclassified Campylobacter]MDA3042985.1 GspE/PulE family protein [Campylobacter sp. JMF_09 ED2]MDA3044180.1 GspE/PulE family protein [Campylobacter sp. JMF_07 ED4]MDA3046380.1 GspE/PulE family protein [Campylobacter sp. VBCF_06 NA8]MDA3049338.1 GspE/PulE family protein [Campylobacter sp. JMF_15 NE4]MDA3051236.1 GspE/PulE family protein [Campylobacter sp. JMF_02 ED1]